MQVCIKDDCLRRRMKELLDDLSIWRWLHSPLNQWRGATYSGDARAVDWRLSLPIKHPIFSMLSVHQINTKGKWSYGHTHESGFVSLVIAEGYESHSWYQTPYYNFNENMQQHCTGDIVPFADVDRFHSLKTKRPVRTIVLWTPSQIKSRRQPAQALPRVNLDQDDPRAILEKLSLIRQEFIWTRCHMKQGL